MINHFLFTLFFLSTFTVIAQDVKRKPISPFNFRVDTLQPKNIAFESGEVSTTNARYNHIIDSAFKLDKNYEFEFRLWKRHLEYNFDNVFILRLVNNKWIARYFDLNECYGDIRKFKERKVDQTKVNQLWRLLEQHKVLSLPSQEALNEKLQSYSIDTVRFSSSISRTYLTDGILYSFQLADPDKVRHYSYACPQTYLKNYGNVEELYHAVYIIILIEKFLGQKIGVC